MQLFVARQPIFDRTLTVVAYEMLYRSGMTNSFDGTDARTATAKVISAVFYSPDGSNLLAGRPAFINFPDSLLLDDSALFLPQTTVIEILETVDPTEQIIASCKRLRAGNYKIALDDFVDTGAGHPLAEFASYIKVDFRATNRDDRLRIARRYGSQAILLAEKVEAEEDFRWASENGYSLFQGYFFAKPRVTSISEVSGFKLNFLHILQKICASDIDFVDLATIVEREPGLSYKLLRLANSALFGRRQPATSVHQAMLRVGENETRKWLSIIVMIDLASDRPSEVMVSALIRARFCELLGTEAGIAAKTEELFMLGLFSRLDAMFSRSLADLLDDVKLPEEIRKTLLNPSSADTVLSRLWSIVLAYEAGEWNTVSNLLTEIEMDSDRVHSIYSDAVTWADSTLHRS